MAKTLDRIVVIDLEATCWAGDPPDGQVSEVIEIGVCTVEVGTGDVGTAESLLVAPQRSTVSPYCTALTTLTAEQVAEGMPFAEACGRLRREYRTRDRLWASWGDYDRRQFERQCRDTEVGYPFGTSHLNVKIWFAVAAGLPHEVGMDAALAHLGWPLEGTHHRGVDDARNIARILSLLIRGSRGGVTAKRGLEGSGGVG